MHQFVRRVREERGSERGFFMVWFALMFTTLLGFAGLALEYNRWQNIGTRTQKAADAAALAGAVFLPDNLTQAQTTAKSTAAPQMSAFAAEWSKNVSVTAVSRVSIARSRLNSNMTRSDFQRVRCSSS